MGFGGNLVLISPMGFGFWWGETWRKEFRERGGNGWKWRLFVVGLKPERREEVGIGER